MTTADMTEDQIAQHHLERRILRLEEMVDGLNRERRINLVVTAIFGIGVLVAIFG